MKIAKVNVTRPADEEGDLHATICIEFMEYEVQEMANQERDRIERGLPIGDARVAIDRFSLFRLALNKAAEAKREADRETL